ncbi:MAG: type VI secretion system tip protein VgrG [Polyangiaceae bacterium]|nr:type VI secretion system tip protein VgrG [Polyangiaceae bacterium]
MSNLTATIASGDSLDVRSFQVQTEMSGVFLVSLVVRTKNADIDFDTVVGAPASFNARPRTGTPLAWSGLCSDMELLAAEPGGLSTHRLTIVPKLWLLTQRRNYRMFQFQSEIDIASALLGEWGIQHERRLTSQYKKRKYRVQYGESDYDFLSRMLEDAGVSFFCEEGESLVLSDTPQEGAPRVLPLLFRDNVDRLGSNYATDVTVGRRVRPGKYVLQDHDYRRPAGFSLAGTAAGGLATEARLERFHYVPGASLFEAAASGETPNADDRGASRHDPESANRLAKARLASKQARARQVSFRTDLLDIAAGAVITMADHPRSDLGLGKPQLVLSSLVSGSHDGEWSNQILAVDASKPYAPMMKTPKPRTKGVESATVVGPTGEEIHTDEFGRVRVRFHWDREAKGDETSSCWIHVNQPWSGSGYGGSNLPRIGQEVLVDFLGGDPDRPVIIGRVYTNLQKTPYKLPDDKTRSGWRSNSTGGGGGYNELMFEDRLGGELVNLQAQRDMTVLVKNDESKNVVRNRKHAIGNNNEETVAVNERYAVGQKQELSVGDSRDVQVAKDQNHTIGDTATTQAQNGSIVNTAKDAITNSAAIAYVDAKESVIITCGASTFFMNPKMIILQSERVFINPGEKETAKAVQAGANGTITPLSEIEAAKKAEEQAKAAAARAEQQRKSIEYMGNAYWGMGGVGFPRPR